MTDDDKQNPRSVAQHAEHFRTSPSAVDRLRKRGAPLHDDEAMREWVRAGNRVPTAVNSFLFGDEGPETGDADPDWAEFEQQARTSDPKESMEKIAKARDFAAFKFERASRTNNKDAMKFYSDLLAKMESCLHDAQLRAKKLGIDNAELFRRQDVERVFSVMGVWLIRAVDESLARLVPELCSASASGQLNRDDTKKLLEAELLSARVLTPLKRAVSEASAVGLPDWAPAAIERGIADVLEEKQEIK